MPRSLLVLLASLASAAAAQPANDDFASATPIPGPGTVGGTTVGATLEPGETPPSCQTSHGASAWWTYTPPADGLLSVDLGGSDFDTVVTVYQPGQTEAGCNDDVGFPTVTSRIANVPVSGNVAVYVRVSGYRSPDGSVEQGAVALTLSFTDAALVTTALPPGDTAGQPTFNHPADLGTGASGSCRLSTAGTAVPYETRTFTVATAGAYTVTVTDAETPGYDSFLLLYRDPFVASDPCLNLLAFDDDGTPAPDDAQIAGATLAAGASYTLVVTGFNNLDVGRFAGSVVGPAAVAFAPVAGEALPADAHSTLSVGPNPSSGLVRVRVRSAPGQPVTVAVVDAAGRLVATLARGAVAADGGLDLGFDASALPAGVYVVRATGPRVRLAQRLTVVR